MVLLLVKKRTLFSKIGAVSAHESKEVSFCAQLSLQALVCSHSELTVLFYKLCCRLCAVVV